MKKKVNNGQDKASIIRVLRSCACFFLLELIKNNFTLSIFIRYSRRRYHSRLPDKANVFHNFIRIVKMYFQSCIEQMIGNFKTLKNGLVTEIKSLQVLLTEIKFTWYAHATALSSRRNFQLFLLNVLKNVWNVKKNHFNHGFNSVSGFRYPP